MPGERAPRPRLVPAPRRRRRRIGLAPLVDVVFLLLVFFLLASRFDRERALPLSVTAAAPSTASAPVAIDVALLAAGGARIDGRDVPEDALAAAIGKRLAETPDRPVWLRPEADVSLARIHSVLDGLAARGAPSATLVKEF